VAGSECTAVAGRGSAHFQLGESLITDRQTRGEPVILSTHPSYPNACAYVLKLHRDARPGLGRVMGRIENVTTGEQFMFASAEELLACLARDSVRNQTTD
jgi:hypothetical protein